MKVTRIVLQLSCVLPILCKCSIWSHHHPTMVWWHTIETLGYKFIHYIICESCCMSYLWNWSSPINNAYQETRSQGALYRQHCFGISKFKNQPHQVGVKFYFSLTDSLNFLPIIAKATSLAFHFFIQVACIIFLPKLIFVLFLFHSLPYRW